jgi:NaMN:DMB phosphoribosyltransferase
VHDARVVVHQGIAAAAAAAMPCPVVVGGPTTTAAAHVYISPDEIAPLTPRRVVRAQTGLAGGTTLGRGWSNCQTAAWCHDSWCW